MFKVVVLNRMIGKSPRKMEINIQSGKVDERFSSTWSSQQSKRKRISIIFLYPVPERMLQLISNTRMGQFIRTQEESLEKAARQADIFPEMFCAK